MVSWKSQEGGIGDGIGKWGGKNGEIFFNIGLQQIVLQMCFLYRYVKKKKNESR